MSFSIKSFGDIFKEDEGGSYYKLKKEGEKALKNICGPKPLLPGKKRDEWNQCMLANVGGEQGKKALQAADEAIEAKCGKRPLFKGKKRDAYNKCADELTDAPKTPAEPEGNEVAPPVGKAEQPAAEAEKPTKVNVGEPEGMTGSQIAFTMLGVAAAIYILKKIIF